MRCVLLVFVLVLAVNIAGAACFNSDSLLYPNGGETLFGNVNIQWNITDCGEVILISYSDNGCAGVFTSIGSVNCTAGTYVWDTTSLADGDQFCIKIEDNTSDVSDSEFSIDNAGIVFSDYSPENGNHVNKTSPSIRVVLSADSGVNQDSIIMQVEGINYTVDNPDGALTYLGSVLIFTPPPPDYSDGEKIEMLLWASDNNGLEKTTLWHFYVDTQAPKAKIISVSPNPAAINDTITVIGELEDTTSKISSAWVVFNDETYPMDALDGLFDESKESLTVSIDLTGLPVGIYSLYIQGNDSMDFVSSPSINETFSIIPGSSVDGPLITAIEFDKPSYEINDENITVTIKEDDSSVNVTVDGTRALKIADNTWQLAFSNPALIGTYSILVEAWNGHGRVSREIATYHVVNNQGGGETPEIIESSPYGQITDNNPILSVRTDENAWCKFDTSFRSFNYMRYNMTGMELNHTYDFGVLEDDSHVYYAACSDSSDNVVEFMVTFWLDTSGNFDYVIDLNKNWNNLDIPGIPMLESMGYSAESTDGWRIDTFFDDANLNGDYTTIWYNVDQTKTGWKSYDAGEWEVSSLKYINHSNSRPYFIYMAGQGRFELE